MFGSNQQATMKDHQRQFYLKVDSQGRTQVTSSLGLFSSVSSSFYRQVYDPKGYRNQALSTIFQNSLFRDPQFQINLATQFGERGDFYTLMRLSTLYGKNRPDFFDNKLQPTRPKDVSAAPAFLHELNLYSTEHYRGFFITQDYSSSGRYVLIICVDGKFETICVDDYIPVNRLTLMPMYGMTFERPWELILLKAWAKFKGGYHNLESYTRPFDLIQNFTNPTWKYYNLVRQQRGFLDRYTNTGALQHAKIILRTKSDTSVRSSGLLENSAGYEIKDISKHNNHFIILVRSTVKHHWNGSMSYIDQNVVDYYNSNSSRVTLNLDRDFLINEKDLNLVFSSAYITAKRQNNFVFGSKLIEYRENQEKSHYYEFLVTKAGFLDFSFKQFRSNIIGASDNLNNTNLQASHLNANQRYPETFFILAKDTEYSGSSEIDKSAIHSLNATTATRNRKQFKPVRFMKYEMDFSKGYNRGDAKFLVVDQGRYIVRFRSQFMNRKSFFQLGWVSNSEIKVKECFLSNQQKDRLLHESFTEVFHSHPFYYLQRTHQNELAANVASFDTLKYGYYGAKVTLNSTALVVISVDPQQLANQGYLLKGKYKHHKQKFVVEVKPGQYETIVFKKKYNATQHLWPLKSIRIYKSNQEGLLGSNVGSSQPRANQSNVRS